jgi:hypothetical protein
MRLFRKRNPKNYPKAEALAERIAGRIVRKQTKMANYLNRKTAYWNTASKVIALALFCLLFGSICLYFIIKSF